MARQTGRDFAINDGLFVVLNIHWDGAGCRTACPSQSAVNVKQQAYWTQIATTFKAYDQHLLSARTNEVHADFRDTETENITVQQSCPDLRQCRARDRRRRPSRTLVVQTYNTNMQHGLNFFTLPTDTIANRLIVETHFYDPFDFTLNTTGSCLFWGAPFPPRARAPGPTSPT
jgi:hypothetical protein